MVTYEMQSRNIPYYPTDKADQGRFKTLCKDAGLKPMCSVTAGGKMVVYVLATWSVVEQILSTMALEQSITHR
jgi:hypothetical protein